MVFWHRSVHFLRSCPCQDSQKSGRQWYLGYTPWINSCSRTQRPVNQSKGAFGAGCAILGGGTENILSSGGSVRNKFFGVVSLCTLTTKTGCHAGEKLSEAQTCTTLLESQQVLHEFPSTDSPNLGSFSWRPNPVAYWELENLALECRWRNVNQGLRKWSLSVLPEASRLLLAITHTGFSYSQLKGVHTEGHTALGTSGSEYVCRAAVDSPTKFYFSLKKLYWDAEGFLRNWL